jgi:hypothetical protein
MTAPPLRFHRADIDDFGPEEVQRFVEQWSNALFHRQPSLGADNTRSLVAAIRGRPELRELAKNPVMLTCLCVIHYNEEGELPSGRARVYRAIVRWMLRAREAQRRDHFADAADSLADNALHRLAVAMMEGTARRPGKIAAMDIGDAAAAIEGEIQRYFPNDPAPRDRAERWIRSECELSALVEEVAGNQIKFWHLTIQEFLAAWAIARRSDWWREIERRLDDPQWDKVVDLFSGCVFEAGGRDRVDELVEKILDRGEGEGLRREAETLVHLERVLAPMDAYKYREDHALVIRQKALAERVMAIFTKEGALQVPVKTRIAAAEVIGQWGDPRLAEGVDNFIEIPGTGLRLGKFPVTVGEYGRFIAAGGYQNTRYWDEAGVAWKAEYERIDPWDWDDQQEHPNRPVMGVSWHEARAYCGWLSEGLDGGRRARLPTAAEWEHAATPKTGEYPWGTDQDGANKQLSDEDLAEQFANFKKSVGAPSPVGVCPAGGQALTAISILRAMCGSGVRMGMMKIGVGSKEVVGTATIAARWRPPTVTGTGSSATSASATAFVWW